MTLAPMLVDSTKPCVGTPEQIAANYASHTWTRDDQGPICARCDATLAGHGAYYPCGTDPDREVRIFYGGQIYLLGAPDDRVPGDWPEAVRHAISFHRRQMDSAKSI